MIALSCGNRQYVLSFVTNHACDRRTDGQKNDSQDRASIVASLGKNSLSEFPSADIGEKHTFYIFSIATRGNCLSTFFYRRRFLASINNVDEEKTDCEKAFDTDDGRLRCWWSLPVAVSTVTPSAVSTMLRFRLITSLPSCTLTTSAGDVITTGSAGCVSIPPPPAAADAVEC